MSIFSHSRWNLIALGFVLTSNLISVPFVINKLGLFNFGRAGILLAAWAPLLLIGNVLGQSAIKIISSRLSSEDEIAAQRTISTSFYLCVLFSLVAGLLFLIIGFLVLHFKLIGGYSFYELILIVFAGVLQQVVVLFQSFATARQRFKFIAKYTAFSSFITLFFIVVIVSYQPSVVGYLLGIFFGFLGSAISWWIGLVRLQGRLFFKSYKPEVREIFKFGYLQSISQVAGTFSNQIDRYMLASFSGALFVGQFNAARRLQEAFYMLVVKASEVLFPHFGYTTNSSLEYKKNFYLLSSWMVVTFSALTLGPIMTLAYPALHLWVGEGVANGGGFLLSIAVASSLVNSSSLVYTYCALGTGQLKYLVRISIAYSVITVGLTVILILLIGPYAAGLGMLIASVVRVILSILIVKRHFFKDVRLTELFVSSIMPILITFLLAILWSFYVSSIIFTWPYLIAMYIVISLSILISILATSSMSVFGRILIINNLRRRFSKLGKSLY